MCCSPLRCARVAVHGRPAELSAWATCSSLPLRCACMVDLACTHKSPQGMLQNCDIVTENWNGCPVNLRVSEKPGYACVFGRVISSTNFETTRRLQWFRKHSRLHLHILLTRNNLRRLCLLVRGHCGSECSSDPSAVGAAVWGEEVAYSSCENFDCTYPGARTAALTVDL